MYNSESRTSREISLNSSLEAIYVHHMLTETTYTIQMSAVTRAGEGVRSQLIVIGTIACSNSNSVVLVYCDRRNKYCTELSFAIFLYLCRLLCFHCLSRCSVPTAEASYDGVWSFIILCYKTGTLALIIIIIIIGLIIIIIRQLIRRRNMSIKSLQGRRTAYATRN